MAARNSLKTNYEILAGTILDDFESGWTSDNGADTCTCPSTDYFKTVQQPDLVVRAHNVPVDDKESMDAWALGVVAGKKNELRSAASAKTIDPRITTEQTVSDPAK